MIEAIYNFVWVIESFATAPMMFGFLSTMFITRTDGKAALSIKMVFCMLAIRYINSFGSSTLNLCGGLAVLVVSAVWMFRISFGNAILYLSFFLIILVNVEMAAVPLRPLLKIENGASISGILFVLAEIFAKIFFVEIVKKQVRGAGVERDHSYMIFLSLFTAAVFILLIGGIYPDAAVHRQNIFLLFSSVFFLLANVVGFSAEEKMMETARNQQNNRLMAQKAELEQLHYRRMEELTREYGEYVHELERSLRTIRQMWEDKSEALSAHLETSANSLGRRFQKQIYMSDPIINAMLTEMGKKCRDQRLRYDVSISPGLSLDFIQDIDKISMFGNLLDNAAEAAGQTEDGFVSVALYMGNKALLVFKVENSCIAAHRVENNHYFTTKRDKKSHGFGIAKIKELALKYNGILDLNQESGKFTASLILSTISSDLQCKKQ